MRTSAGTTKDASPSLPPSLPPKGRLPQVQSFGKYVGHGRHGRQSTHLRHCQVRKGGMEGGREGRGCPLGFDKPLGYRRHGW